MATKKPRFLVVITPDGTETRTEYKARPPYEALRDAVGGLIERVKVRHEGKIREAYVSEEGLIHGLPYNKTATDMMRDAYPAQARAFYGQSWPYLVGNLAVIL
jgi:hypothetical protein